MPQLSADAYDAWERGNTERMVAMALPAITQAFGLQRCVMAVTVELDILDSGEYVCQVTIWRRGIVLPLHQLLAVAPLVHERYSWKIVEYDGTTWGKDPEWEDEPDEEHLAEWVEDTGERPDQARDFPRIGPKRGFLTPEAALRDAIADRLDGVGPPDEGASEGGRRCC